MGLLGTKFTMEKIIHISEQEFTRATLQFKRFGIPCLLFAWVPIIGDPLTIAAGILRINFFLFLILVTTGKTLRYLVIAAAVIRW
jgi:membrane protein YqaA with SNARE-associated domain